MFVRQLEYLVTLAREKHFARAAEACSVSQPALSAGIRQLEQELGVALIERSHRYQGLTREGEHVLTWARATLAAWDGLRQEASRVRTSLAGTLRLGAIPTTMPVVPLLVGSFRAAHAGMQHVVLSLSAEEIMRRIDDYELDLGLTYLEHRRLDSFRVLPLYRERYLLLARSPESIGHREQISWQEAAQLPLCLLTPNMQNRHIVDGAFQRAHAEPNVAVETDSVFALYSLVRGTDLFSIVPHSVLCLFEMREEMIAIPLVPPLHRGIGLITRQRDPLPPIAAAAWGVAQTLKLDARFDNLISAVYQPIRHND